MTEMAEFAIPRQPLSGFSLRWRGGAQVGDGVRRYVVVAYPESSMNHGCDVSEAGSSCAA